MKTNFHCHTYRCGHAIGDEEEMIKSAIDEGIEEFGFSEHVPLPNYRYHLLKGLPYTLTSGKALASAIVALVNNGPHMRLSYLKKDEHQRKVQELKTKYQDQIKIYQGYEAEYFEDYLPYYQQLLDSKEVDYLILGHHFDKYSVATRYYGKMSIQDQDIIRYKDDVLKALDTDLFTYIAHPDLFMIGKMEFDTLCENITREICQKAYEKDIPLEINAGGIRRGYRKVNDELQYPYPNSHFFDIASEIGCKVVLGLDVHDPNHFNQDDIKALEKFAWRRRLQVIDKPVFKKGKNKDEIR